MGLVWLPWRDMTEKTRDEVLAEYEAAARRSSVLGHRWEQMVLIEPLRPGEHEPTITREQIELEDEMRGRGRTTSQSATPTWRRPACRNRPGA
jgi:hypothetical protein